MNVSLRFDVLCLFHIASRLIFFFFLPVSVWAEEMQESNNLWCNFGIKMDFLAKLNFVICFFKFLSRSVIHAVFHKINFWVFIET